MRYYISRSSSTVPKNKAQEHIQEFIRQFFNMTVNSNEDLNGLIKRIKKKVEETNVLYRKCSRMDVCKQGFERALFHHGHYAGRTNPPEEDTP